MALPNSMIESQSSTDASIATRTSRACAVTSSVNVKGSLVDTDAASRTKCHHQYHSKCHRCLAT